jgi:hypothetical protein
MCRKGYRDVTEARPPNHAPDRRYRRKWLLAAVCVLALAAVFLFLNPLRMRYFAHRLATAETAEEEYEAFVRVNRSGGWTWFLLYPWDPSYEVRMFDADNEFLRFDDASSFQRVEYVEVIWPGGYSVRRRLLKKENLRQLLYE